MTADPTADDPHVEVYVVWLSGAWTLSIVVGDDETVGPLLEFDTPGAALDWAMKWCADRGLQTPRDPVSFIARRVGSDPDQPEETTDDR